MESNKSQPMDDNDLACQGILQLDQHLFTHNSIEAHPQSHLQAEHNLAHTQHGVIHVHQNNQSSTHQEDLPIFDSSNQLRFYLEFNRIYSVSHHLALEKQRQFDIYQNLIQRIQNIQDKIKDKIDHTALKKQQNSDQNKLKRSRRTAEEIQKKFKCSVQFCQRFYGSEGSLQQHIKLKHPALYTLQYSNSDSIKEQY